MLTNIDTNISMTTTELNMLLLKTRHAPQIECLGRVIDRHIYAGDTRIYCIVLRGTTADQSVAADDHIQKTLGMPNATLTVKIVHDQYERNPITKTIKPFRTEYI